MASKISWLQAFTLLLLEPRSRESIRWSLLLSFRNDCWVEEKNSWLLTDLPQIRKVMKRFLPRLEAVDAKEGGSIKTVFGQTLMKKYIYWTLCDYLIFRKSLYHNFLVIRWSLIEKENLKLFFDVKNFIFRGHSYQPYATDFSITFCIYRLEIWYVN